MKEVKLSKTNNYITYVASKGDKNSFIYKTEIDTQTWKTGFWLPKGRGRGAN